MGIPAYSCFKDDGGANTDGYPLAVAIPPRGVVALVYGRPTWHYPDGQIQFTAAWQER